MSVSEFLRGVRSFNDQFLASMAGRVHEICDGWDRPDVRVDLAHLAFEQVDRSTWLEKELAKRINEDMGELMEAANLLRAIVPLPKREV